MNGVFSYLFGTVAAPNNQDGSRRATLQQFQGYPYGSVEGRGQLVTQNGVFGGKYWNIVQPPQVVAQHVPVVADIVGAGEYAGTLYNQALVKNGDTIGI